ncbi:polysaccharide deacetylase family protein [Sporosarcina sp. 179-K 3D1 HS]|uniref:polysaccharide deacetylase family protein n=1 Tax=Sporosarcina sp. 179-K 3D1 HS TaxID=3232169 RepID=UPI0039A13571
MKERVWAMCFAFIISFGIGMLTGEAAERKQDRYVGLHDRLLPIEDVRVIDNNTKVPLADIAKYLYLPLSEEDGAMHIRKRGFDISYDYKTKQTTKNGVEQKGAPITEVDGKLYISVIYIAKEVGFKIEYFPKLKTLRIYRDDYPHMSHTDYEKQIQALLNKKPAIKANVYLTFDDGPNQYTTLNTATLEKNNVQGTFFFVGKHMKNNEKIVKATAAGGHYIGSHSMTHDKDNIYKSTKSFMTEMNEGIQLIQTMTGQDSKLLRVPYGSKPHVTPAMRVELNKRSYKMWDWDVDSNDWKYTDKQTDAILKNVQVGVEKAYKSGDRDIIILMHDRSQSAKALPAIIEWLQAQGYTIKKYEPDHHVMQNFHKDSKL